MTATNKTGWDSIEADFERWRKTLPPVDQVAVAPQDADAMVKALKFLGHNEWTEDYVTTVGDVIELERYEGQETVAHLQFNYSLLSGGLEFEVLKYISGPNWLYPDLSQSPYPLFSHLSFHAYSDYHAAELFRFLTVRWPMVQRVRTTNHTNAKVPEWRRYAYTIFRARHELGFDLKVIERLDLREDK